MHLTKRKLVAGVSAIAAGAITVGIAGAAQNDRDPNRATGAEPRGIAHHGPALTGEAKSKAEAAALAAVPGGTVRGSSEEQSAEANGAKYEVHVTDADGKPVEVLLDGDFKVIAKQTRADRPGFGHGRPGEGHHGTPLTGDAAAKAKAAALAELPGGKVVESFEHAVPGVSGSKYVVIATSKDGTPSAVVLDKDFKVLATRTPPARFGDRGSHQRPDELKGATADKAEQAALAAVPGGEVRAAFAARPGGSEAYVVLVEGKSGAPVAVLLDKDFKVLRKVSRPEHGRPGDHHHGFDGDDGPGEAGESAPAAGDSSAA